MIVDQWLCEGEGSREEGTESKRIPKGNFQGGGHIYFLDCGYCFMGQYECLNSSNYMH